ncbi:MAG: peptidylprolyl isomerase [Bacteroidales bacterium]|nr:peptidylprolyl isomerase [Bacteroidales bacterium]
MNKKNNFFGKLIICLFFAFSAAIIQAQPSGAKVIDNVVAIVGNNIILQSDIENQYMQLRAQGYFSDGDLKCDILEEMLFQKLLLHQADLDSVEISNKDVEDNLNNRLVYFINELGSEEALEKMYGKSLTEIKEEFREIIKDMMIVEKMQAQITTNVKVTPAEVREFFISQPEDSIPEIEEEYSLALLSIKPKITKQAREEVIEKLEGFRKRIEEGTPFSSLAVLYSKCPSSKNGGDLGFFGRADMVPEFSAVAFKLKVGEVSRPVETQMGFHIIQVTERKGELIKAQHILLNADIGRNELLIAKNKADSIRNAIISKSDSLNFDKAVELFSQDEDTKFNDGKIMNPYTGSIKFHSDELPKDVLSQIKNLKTGDISKPFESTDKNNQTVYKIIKVIEKTNKHKASLKTDYDFIQSQALAVKKQEIINKWIKQKQETTYIKLNESFVNCKFNLDGWVKK